MAGAENTLNTSAVMANELMTNPTSAEVAPSASASNDTSTFTIWMTSHMMPFTMNRLMNDLLQMPALPIATPPAVRFSASYRNPTGTPPP